MNDRTRFSRVRKIGFVVALVCCSGTFARSAELPTAKPEDVGMSTERLARIHEMIQRHIDAGDIQGAVTAVARRGKVVHYEAHGWLDAENKKPMTKDAIFRMASSTKPVTAVATLMMVEEGKIRLGDPVNRYIPEFKNTKVAVIKGGEAAERAARTPNSGTPEIELVPASRDITISDLLTHTSGLLSSGAGSRAPGGQVRRGADDTLATYIPKLGAVPLDFQPGTRWAYSGGAGPDVLSRIVEITSGMPYDQFLQKRIFDPLGMKDTSFNLPDEKQSRRVVISGGGRGGRAARGGAGAAGGATRSGPTKYFSGAGGLSSTCYDYLQFEQMLAGGGALYGNRLLSPRTVEQMGTNHVGKIFHGLDGRDADGTMGYGYLVYVVLDNAHAYNGRSNGSFGWGGAFGTISWTDPKEKMTCVIMLQQRHQETQRDFEFAVRQAIID